MTRILSITAVIVALVALGAPGLSLGMGIGTGAQLSAPVQVDAWSAEQVAARPGGCKSLGGKRVLPCHTDLGVLTVAAPVIAPMTRYRPWRNAALPFVSAVPEAELPPPRLA